MPTAARKALEMVVAAAAFTATIILLQALDDAESLPRRLLAEWSEAIRDRRAFVQTVRDTIEQLPTRKGDQ